jgi:hypothetical protein
MLICEKTLASCDWLEIYVRLIREKKLETYVMLIREKRLKPYVMLIREKTLAS